MTFLGSEGVNDSTLSFSCKKFKKKFWPISTSRECTIILILLLEELSLHLLPIHEYMCQDFKILWLSYWAVEYSILSIGWCIVILLRWFYEQLTLCVNPIIETLENEINWSRVTFICYWYIFCYYQTWQQKLRVLKR